MAFLIAVVAFITLLIIIILCYNYITGNGHTTSNRIEQYVQKAPIAQSLPFAQVAPSSKDKFGLWKLLVKTMSKYLSTVQWSRLLEQKLIQAGLPMRGAEFMVICFVVSLVGAAFGLITSGNLINSLFLGMMGFGMPFGVLKLKIEKRKQAFNDQLGDTMVLVANALRTGYSFMQSVDMVAREMPKPIGEEFGRVLKEMNLGVTTEDALNNMAKRVNSDDLDLLITAVLIQRQVGGNLAVVLDSIATTIRERIKIKGHIRTLTAQGKISGIIVGLLPIVIGGVIYLINPEYIKVLFTHPMGKLMLVAGAVSQFIGMMIIRKIINIDI